MAAIFAADDVVAVPSPKTVNMGAEMEWIPLFIQGVITANFQQYSGMKVVDRQNNDMVKAEQKLSESSSYSESDAIELGKMTNARLIVTGSITAKSSSYALIFNITDTETGESKATATVPNCLFSALENGEAANQISYDLMTGYGVKLSAEAKAKLTKAAGVMSAETTAQASVAKGIAAEKSGSNIEALTYYIQAKKNDKNLSEATKRMASMTTVVTGGNFGASAKNLMKLRSDWDKLLKEAAALIAANPPEFTLYYFSNIKANELTAEDYERGMMSFTVGSPYLKQTGGAENEKIANELLDGLHKIPESKNWGDKINGFPWTYADDIEGDNWLKWKSERLIFNVQILDAKKKAIAQEDITFTVRYGNKYRYSYTDEIASDNKKKSRDRYVGELEGFTFSQVDVNDADTDSLYLAVSKKSGRDVSILPVPDGVLSALDIEEIKARRSVKIGGIVNFTEDFCALLNGKDVVDLWEAAIGQSSVDLRKIKAGHREGRTRGKTLIVGDGVSELSMYGCFEELVLPESLKELNLYYYYNPDHVISIDIKYAGSAEQWKNCVDVSFYGVPIGARFYLRNIIYNYDPLHAKNVDAYKASGGVDVSMAADFIASIIPEDGLRRVYVAGEVSNDDYVRIIAAARENKSVSSVNWAKATGSIPDYLKKGGIEGKNAAAFIASITKDFDISTVTIVGNVSADDYTAIKAAKKANACDFYLDFERVVRLSLPDGTTSVPDFRGRAIVIPVSMKSIGYRTFGDDNPYLKIYYRGSKKDWKAIKVDEHNKALKKAEIVFDYKGE